MRSSQGIGMRGALFFSLLNAFCVVNGLEISPPIIAGDAAQALCEGLATTFLPQGLAINNTFSIYYPEGSNPSLEDLTKSYPNGTIPKDVNVGPILDSVGSDFDVKSDAGYGRQKGRRLENNLLGGLPAFCRYGAYIQTSDLTLVLSEVWLPIASNLTIPLPPSNEKPTNTTPYDIAKDSTFRTAPLYYLNGQYVKVKPAAGSSNPPAPNDVPEVPPKKNAVASAMASSMSSAKDGLDSVMTNVKPLAGMKSASDAKAKLTDAMTTLGGMSDKTDMLTKALSRRGVSRLDDRKRRLSRRHSQIGRSIPGEQIIGDQDGWNGRLVVMGNGGQRGFVPMPDMKQYISRYGFAVAGTNLGHFSGTAGVTWVNGSQFDDTILDWASRANHVTLQLSEQVVDAFYGIFAGCRVAEEGNRVRRYFFGSSVGAARGLSAMQVYPEDYHGLLLGPPAQSFMSMNTGQIQIASVHNKTVAKDGWFTQNALYGPIKDVVTRQCDELDGVKDDIISNPFACKPDLAAEMLCGTNTTYGSSNGTCLTAEQINNFYTLYKPTIIDGQTVYPGYLPGLEDSASSMNSNNAKASGWHQLVVLKQPMLNNSFNPFTDIRFSDLQRGIEQDPGGGNAAKTDLSAFINAGGKMMLYHGTYDLVISPQATIDYYQQALRDSGPYAAHSLKFYIVPGMRHSRGGPGAYHFGGPTQTGVGNRPLRYETGYDMTLALLAWVEKGIAPRAQIAARYAQRSAEQPARATGNSTTATDLPLPDTNQNFNWGLNYTRLLCPWPRTATYNGGNTDGDTGYQAFECR